MDNQAASKILELMAIDLTGLLDGLPRRNPMVDVIEQRIESINTAQKALSDAHKDTLPHGRWEMLPYTEMYKNKCSFCGNGSDLETDYCPKCGAKMV